MNGAPSVQMQEIPPDLMGWLEAEERNAEEKEEERKNREGGKAVGDERKKDGHKARNEFFDGERDGERDKDMVGGGVAKGSGKRPVLGGGGGGNGVITGGSASGAKPKGRSKSKAAVTAATNAE